MDTVKVIKQKIEILASIILDDTGISSVLRHVKVAESHFSNAQAKQDKDLFTDVVYRSNHAFEGILKEAYAVLAKQNPAPKSEGSKS